MNEGDLQYGEWLWASPLKSRRRNLEAELREEKRLFLAFRNNGNGRARMKLSFDESATSARTVLGGGTGAKSVTINMQVDERVVVVPGNEALKRKLDCHGGNEEAEKVRVVGDATGGYAD